MGIEKITLEVVLYKGNLPPVKNNKLKGGPKGKNHRRNFDQYPYL